ncbi:hypothetical protein [Caulobacter sp. RL271]|uniref:Uncharacterized protein n=1 Tax=Caulobacter segnis TaxID=88688 RepID=A0ABY4ZWZ2_9CAUL|nr:hypothetical protein [Caulobacter segnis]USQ97291.1 hypothetical protein MZV50_07030 [Caulobacter segnis]
MLTPDQHRLCRARTAFLLYEVNRPDQVKLIDLLANAYHQGLVDAVETMDKRGWIRPPDSAPAQQDGWA